MDSFRNFLEQYVPVPYSEWQVIMQAFDRKEFARNELILSEGKICRYFYFIEKGLVRFFSATDGNDITKFFTVAPYCFTSKNSFLYQTPSKESIQALENTVIWQITLEESNALLELKSWSTFTRKFVHEVQSYTEDLMMQIKTETAEQRYLKLLEKHPEIIHRIPLKHLSSFLGIAPPSLSRIRKKYQQKND